MKHRPEPTNNDQALQLSAKITAYNPYISCVEPDDATEDRSLVAVDYCRLIAWFDQFLIELLSILFPALLNSIAHMPVVWPVVSCFVSEDRD